MQGVYALVKTKKTTKPSLPKTSPASAKPSAKPRTATKAKAKTTARTLSWQDALNALPVDYESKINRSVGDVLFDAGNLRKLLTKEWPRLSKKSVLPSDIVTRLQHHTSHLEEAEGLWSEARQLRTPAKLVKAREQGRLLRSDAVAALRYFLRENDEVQARVDAIVDGDGDADLIDDLRKLATLIDEHRASLSRAELPAGGSNAFRKLGETLAEETSEQASDVKAAKALALRNRAYWALRELMSEIRAAGHYVFRKEPLTAAKFVDPLRSTASPKAPTTPPAPAKPPT